MLKTIPPDNSDDLIFNKRSSSNAEGTSLANRSGFHGITISADFTGTIYLRANQVFTAGSSKIMGGTITSEKSGADGFAMNMSGPFQWGGGTIKDGTSIIVNSAMTIEDGLAVLDNASLEVLGGSVTVVKGTLDARNRASIQNDKTFDVTAGKVTNSSGLATFTNKGTLTVGWYLTTTALTNKGSLVLNAGGEARFTGVGIQDTDGASTVFNGGSMTVTNGYYVQAGSLTGSAAGSKIVGDLINSGGTVDPGGTTGTLEITGDYTQTSGVLAIAVDRTSNNNSKLAVGGMVKLADTLRVTFTAGPGRGPWTLITYGATDGSDFARKQTSGPKYEHITPDVGNTYKIRILPPAGMGMNINGVEGIPFSGVVADFFDPGSASPAAGDYAATIDWGDGTTSAGAISDNGNGIFQIIGDHTYTEENPAYAVTIQLGDAGADPSDTINCWAAIADAPLTATGQNGSATVGQAFSGVLASFADADPNGAVEDYTATIYWADGSTSAGAISAGAGGSFQVSGAHVFASAGTYGVMVMMSDAGGAPAGAGALIVVSDPASSNPGDGPSLGGSNGSPGDPPAGPPSAGGSGASNPPPTGSGSNPPAGSSTPPDPSGGGGTGGLPPGQSGSGGLPPVNPIVPTDPGYGLPPDPSLPPASSSGDPADPSTPPGAGSGSSPDTPPNTGTAGDPPVGTTPGDPPLDPGSSAPATGATSSAGNGSSVPQGAGGGGEAGQTPGSGGLLVGDPGNGIN